MTPEQVLLVDTFENPLYWEFITPEMMPIGPNLWLLSVATYLQENGFEAKIVDSKVDRNYLEILKRELTSHDTPYCLVSVLTTSLNSGIKISEYIRKVAPDVPIAWGSVNMKFMGPFVDLYPVLVLENPLVDIVCLGDEATYLQLAEELSRGKKADLSQVQGIGFNNEGPYTFTSIPKPLGYDKLPPENYDLVDMKKYIWRSGIEFDPHGSPMKRIVPILTTRSCPHQCTFCINSLHKYPTKIKPAEMIIEQIKNAVKKYNANVIWFQDANSFVKMKVVAEVFDGVEDLDFKWVGQTRVDYFDEGKISDDLFRRIAKKCHWFGVGFETASDRLRNVYKKGKNVTKEKLEHVLELCEGSNVPTFCAAFIVGTVDETREEMLETGHYIMELIQKFPHLSITYQAYRPYPGTIEYEKAVREGYREPSDLREWAKKVEISLRTISYEDYPWLKREDKKLIRRLLLLCSNFPAIRYANFRGAKFLWPFIHKIYVPTAKFRLKRDCWSAPIDMFLGEKMKER